MYIAAIHKTFIVMEKQKYELEFTFNTSQKLIFQRLSTPSGLSEWFADKVTFVNKNYAFEWNGSVQEAKVLSKKANEYIRFQWLEEEDEDTFFEFRVTKDELTRDVALIITDFAEKDEIDDSKDLWEQQVGELKRAMGI